jgi:hypothetical protein
VDLNSVTGVVFLSVVILAVEVTGILVDLGAELVVGLGSVIILCGAISTISSRFSL